MKWQYAILAFALFSAASAETYEEEEGDPRIFVDGDPRIFFTNSTYAFTNAVPLGVLVLLGVVSFTVWIIGFGYISKRSDTGYGYGFDQGFESSANAYNSFSKR